MPDLGGDVKIAMTEMFSDYLDTWLDEARVALNVRQRQGCWCVKNTKPCEVHDAFDDGICALIDVLQGIPHPPLSGSPAPRDPGLSVSPDDTYGEAT